MKTEIFKITDTDRQHDEIARAAAYLKGGEPVAFPTETVYGLGANALDGDAVKKIFEAKGRPQDNPLIVHITEKEEIRPLVKEVTDGAKRLMDAFWPGPLTIILPKSDIIPGEVSAGLTTVAVRCPSHPVARAFIKACGVPVAAPSANISGFPSPTEFQYVFDDMDGRIPAIIDGGSCDFGIESTVISLAEKTPVLFRPGAVTVEQLQEVLGVEVKVDTAVLNPLQAGKKAPSPGMKYKHYAPKAEISIVRGSFADFADYAASHTNEADAFLCFEGEEKSLTKPCVTMGSCGDPLSQARRLFDALRELDEIGARRVFSRDPSKKGVGLGVCNRLYRAAAFRFLGSPSSTVLGITGGTGSGKSTVCECLKKLGAEIIDADKIARSIVLPGSPVLKSLAESFGGDILLPDGTLDRKALGRKAFSSEENTRLLNSLTHPEIIKKCTEEIAEKRSKCNFIVVDAPLLFVSGLDKICDVTARVDAPAETRLERIMQRDSLTRQDAEKRISAQKEEAALAEKADYTIENTGTPGTLAAECEKLYGKITAREQ